MSDKVERVELTDEEWRRRLTPQQFEVARKGGTEPAFTGIYWDSTEEGIYRCVCCNQPLFKSETKYDSGTGWPSFWDVIDKDAIRLREDRSFGMIRTEALCARCDAHLGHVFPDGPEPTGTRYCMNSASLRLDRTAEED